MRDGNRRKTNTQVQKYYDGDKSQDKPAPQPVSAFSALQSWPSSLITWGVFLCSYSVRCLCQVLWCLWWSQYLIPFMFLKFLINSSRIYNSNSWWNTSDFVLVNYMRWEIMKKIIFYLIPNRWLHLSALVLSTSLSGTCHIHHFTIWCYKWQLSCQIYCPRYCMLLCGLAKLVMLKKTFWFAFYSMHMGCFLATFQQAAGSWKALQRASAEKSWRSRGIIQLRCSWSKIRSTI